MLILFYCLNNPRYFALTKNLLPFSAIFRTLNYNQGCSQKKYSRGQIFNFRGICILIDSKVKYWLIVTFVDDDIIRMRNAEVLKRFVIAA